MMDCCEGYQGTWASEVFTCLTMDEGWAQRGGPQRGTRDLDSNPDSATFGLKNSKGAVSPPEWLVVPMVWYQWSPSPVIYRQLCKGGVLVTLL